MKASKCRTVTLPFSSAPLCLRCLRTPGLFRVCSGKLPARSSLVQSERSLGICRDREEFEDLTSGYWCVYFLQLTPEGLEASAHRNVSVASVFTPPLPVATLTSPTFVSIIYQLLEGLPPPPGFAVGGLQGELTRLPSISRVQMR